MGEAGWLICTLYQHSWKKLIRARHHELKPSQGSMVLGAGMEQGRGETHEGLRDVSSWKEADLRVVDIDGTDEVNVTSKTELRPKVSEDRQIFAQ